MHVNLDLEGYEDVGIKTGEPTGIKLPYIVTFAESTIKLFYLLEEIIKQQIQLKKKINTLYNLNFYLELVFMVLV